MLDEIRSLSLIHTWSANELLPRNWRAPKLRISTTSYHRPCSSAGEIVSARFEDDPDRPPGTELHWLQPAAVHADLRTVRDLTHAYFSRIPIALDRADNYQIAPQLAPESLPSGNEKRILASDSAQ